MCITCEGKYEKTILDSPKLGLKANGPKLMDWLISSYVFWALLWSMDEEANPSLRTKLTLSRKMSIIIDGDFYMDSF